MTLYEIGSLCMKTMGRDSGKRCIVIQHLEEPYVLIDGETRRRKTNKAHLEPLGKTLDVKEKASRKEVIVAFETINITLTETKKKEKTTKPKSERRKKKAEARVVEHKKKEVKKK